ncbi:FUSC family protein [[Pantoea] beijingensis]|uniref:FUSC family protein n=1 Tax=[Pantoea] beijingensis TaxID=1324864 RepID=UPI0015FA1796|nr:FUSC family protein [[Pantoea] beijingensis]
MKWLSKSAVLFSLKTCFAAFLALYIALELNLDRPAWSLTTVYVVSQLYSSSTVSKSVFRFLGTVLGGLFVFLIYPATVLNPILFSFCVSVWVAGCLYLSLHDRTPKSYVFMLAGYSAAIMGFPDVETPLSITYTVISRIEEITVAIICSSLVHRLIFPVSMRNVLENSVSNWYTAARKLCRELLTVEIKEDSSEREAILIQMAGYPANVETLITHCVFEGDAARQLIRLVTVQYQHLSYLVPTLTAIEIRLRQLTDQGIVLPDFVEITFRRFLIWLNEGGTDDTQSVQQDIALTQANIRRAYLDHALSAEENLLLGGLMERLGNFVKITDAYASVGKRVDNFEENTRRIKRTRAHWYVDKGLLMLSSFTAFLATFVTCLFWIGTGWSDGSTAPMMAAVLCSFFAGMDSPIAPMKLFLKGVIVAIVISILYSALFIPETVSFESLIICLAPGLFTLGLVIANPSTNLLGLIIATQIPGLIGMSHHFKPDLLLIVNGAISSLVGIIIAVVITALIRSKRPSWIARRAFRQGIRDLIQFLSEIRLNSASLRARQRFVARMLDKVNVILPRKKIDPAPDLVSGGNLITEVWIGVNFYDFYVKHQSLLAVHGVDIERLFYELNRFLKARLKSLHAMPQPTLLCEINHLLIQLEGLCATDNQLYSPMFYLFNVRLSLFSSQRWPEITARDEA